MSAYMVDRGHIRYLVDALGRGFAPHDGPTTWRAVHGTRRRVAPGMEDGMHVGPNTERVPEEWAARLLHRENVRSVNHRYKSDDPVEPIASIGTEGRSLPLEAVQVIKAVHCYQYQSCEHPGWEASEAKTITDALLIHATHYLPGYDEAAWGAPAVWEREIPQWSVLDRTPETDGKGGILIRPPCEGCGGEMGECTCSPARSALDGFGPIYPTDSL